LSEPNHDLLLLQFHLLGLLLLLLLLFHLLGLLLLLLLLPVLPLHRCCRCLLCRREL
jgi:hypothetical protein